MPIRAVSMAFALAVAAVAVAVPSNLVAAENQQKPLVELSTEDVQSLLRSWNLDRVFGETFEQQQFDGKVLAHVLEDVADADDLMRQLQPLLPQLFKPQVSKFLFLLRSVNEGVDVQLLQEASSEGISVNNEQNARTKRRHLATDEGFSGIEINRELAMLSLGPGGDIALKRTSAGNLTITAQHLTVDADMIEMAAVDGLIVDNTDVVASIGDLFKAVRVLNEEMYYVMEKLNTTCTESDEAGYSCDNIDFDFDGLCAEDIEAGDAAWIDRTYSFKTAPDNLLDTYHTYVSPELDGSPPCPKEGGFYGELAKDAQVAICCANHGSYSSAGNKPYATSGQSGLSNAYGLIWTQHSGTFALNNHAGTPCSYFETYLEAGTHLVCCSEGWATGIFVSEPEVTCD